MAKVDSIVMRVDGDLERKAEQLCEEMGLTLSTAYTMFLKAIVRTRSIPFKVEAADPFYSETNQAYLQESIKELEEGKGQGASRAAARRILDP